MRHVLATARYVHILVTMKVFPVVHMRLCSKASQSFGKRWSAQSWRLRSGTNTTA
jgi:hypothetical protein